MGKIKNVLSTEEIVTNNVNTFIKDSTVSYPSFLDTAPFFVTYYSRSAYQSTYDVSLENYNEVVGEESPNKFHKIEKLPVYSLDTSDFSQEVTDEGWKGEISSSCIILPNTIIPKPDDLIEIEIHSKKYLFQVTNGNSDNFGNTKFYKINFRISQYTSNEVSSQVTEELEVDFELIGKSENILVKKRFVSLITKIENKYDELLAAYKHMYFNTSSQSFVNERKRLIDQFLNYFIDSNNLNKPFLEFRNSCIISPIIKQYLDFSTYKKTFYTMFSDDSIKTIDDLRWFVYAGSSKVEQYKFTYFLKNKYTFVNYTPSLILELQLLTSPILNKTSEEIVLSEDTNLIFLQKYIDLISNANMSDSQLRLENLADTVDTLTMSYDDFNIELEETSIILNYYLVPLILFSLKKIHSLITEL